jgi:hypothetical protein
MIDLFNGIVEEFKADPRNKIFASEQLLIMSVKEETGKQINAVELRKVINKFLAADMTDKDYEIYDGAVAVCGELARSCFGADPSEGEDVDFQIEWCDDENGSFSAVIRPM